MNRRPFHVILLYSINKLKKHISCWSSRKRRYNNMAGFMARAGNFASRFPKTILGTVIGAGLIIPMLPDTVFLQTFQDVYACYNDGKIVKIDQDTESLIQKVLHRINLREEEEGVLKFFTCYQNDPVHKGSVQINSIIHTGAVVGLPSTFAYKTEDDVENSNLRIKNIYAVDWTSSQGQALKQAILLTEQEKAFVIAREINYSNTAHLFIDMHMKTGIGLMAYFTGFGLNRLFSLKTLLHSWARGFVYTAIGGAYLCLYVFAKDAYFYWRDNSIDYKTARISPYYAKGGLGYYEKVLARNVTLREMQGAEGRKLYTAYGNNVMTGVRIPTVQLTKRKENLKDYVQMWEDGKIKKAED